MLKKKTITLFLTHKCNLNCVYCYEKYKNDATMSFELAKNIIDEEFQKSEGYDYIEIDFFGGEPFLEFELIKKITNYVEIQRFNIPHGIAVTTNGTLVHGEIQNWLKEHTHIFQCSLSLDGTKHSHDFNRSNSFDSIDLDFFKETYPNQSVKMTISNRTLDNLFENVKFVHEKGFSISCNLAYNIDWTDTANVSILNCELEKLCEYYLSNPEIKVCSLLDRRIELIGFEKSEIDKDYSIKWCGVCTDMPTYDVDGKRYPCQFFAPITLGKEKSQSIQKLVMERKIHMDLIEGECRTCPVLELCPTCYGANFEKNGSVYKKDMDMCALTKATLKAAAVLKAKQWVAGLLKNKYSKDEEQALIRGIIKINDMNL